MFAIFRLKWKRELEELKSLHRIEIAEKEAKFIRDHEELKRTLRNASADKQWELDRVRSALLKDNELKLRETTTLLKLSSEQKIAQLELDHEKKLQSVRSEMSEKLVAQREELLRTHYEKLASAMAKLHEEGNVTTKFMQEIALKMFDKAPAQKSEMVLLTGETCPKKK